MAYIEKLLSTNERILLRQRQHWMALVSPVFGCLSSLFFLAILGGILFWVYRYLGMYADLQRGFREALKAIREMALLRQVSPQTLRLAGVVVIALIVLDLALRVLRWSNNIDIVTTRRVIRVQGILSKSVIDSSLEKINDVVLQQPILGRWLGYGHLSILTASETGLNMMRFLADPVRFKRAMLDAKQMMATAERGVAASPAPSQATVSERLAQLEQLRLQNLVTPEEFATKRKELLDEI